MVSSNIVKNETNFPSIGGNKSTMSRRGNGCSTDQNKSMIDRSQRTAREPLDTSLSFAVVGKNGV